MQDQHKNRETQDARGAQELLLDLLNAIDQSGSPGLRRHFVQSHADASIPIPGNWALWTIETLCRLSVDEIVKAGDSSVNFIEIFATELIQRLNDASRAEKAATVNSRYSKPPIGSAPQQSDRRSILAHRYGQLLRKHRNGLPLRILKATLLQAGFDHPSSPVAGLSVGAFLELDQKMLTSLFRKESLSLFEECVDVVERFLSCGTIADKPESKLKCAEMLSLSTTQPVSEATFRQPIEIQDSQPKGQQPSSQLPNQQTSKESELIETAELPEQPQVLPWEIALKRIEQNKMGYEMIGHLAPKLRSLPRQFWRRRFCDYFGLTPTEIGQLDGHGDGAQHSLFLAFEAVGQCLPQAPMNEQLAISIRPFQVDRCESILLDLLKANPEELTVNDIAALAQPLLEQIENDLDLYSSEIVSRFCGLATSSATINPKTLADVGEAFSLSRERVRQILERVAELMMLRWPNGPQLLDCLAVKLIFAHASKIADVVYELRARLFGISERTNIAQCLESKGSPQSNPSSKGINRHNPIIESSPTEHERITLTDHIRSVLIDAPRGLTLRDIAARILARGYKSGSRRFENVVYQSLHREKEFFLDKHQKRYFHIKAVLHENELFNSSEIESPLPSGTNQINDLLAEFLEND